MSRRVWLVPMMCVWALIACGCYVSTTAVEKVPTIPEATGYVVDQLGLLDSSAVDQITTFCKSVEPQLQVAVLIVNSTQPWSIEQFGIKVAEKWKVGFKGKDNGVIVILAKSDRKIRIEAGRGAEAFLPDAKAGNIIHDIIAPHFKRGDWKGGMVAGLQAINKEVRQ